jgi:hypothetical protein
MKLKTKRKHMDFNRDKAVQLIVRWDYFSAGYGDKLTADVLKQMKEDWHAHRSEVLKVAAESFPGQPIWAEQEFDK